MADPRLPSMKARINAVKRREFFRPVAPAVLKEAASEYFELERSPLWATMSGTCAVRSGAIREIQSAVHVDGTARPQVVEAEKRPFFHKLLTAFGRRTGVPVLLNTSFNSAAEPIVETADQACASALSMGIDFLYVGSIRIDLRRERP